MICMGLFITWGHCMEVIISLQLRISSIKNGIRMMIRM